MNLWLASHGGAEVRPTPRVGTWHSMVMLDHPLLMRVKYLVLVIVEINSRTIPEIGRRIVAGGLTKIDAKDLAMIVILTIDAPTVLVGTMGSITVGRG